MKQCLNKFHGVEKVMKKEINDDNKISRWSSQCNHLDLDIKIDDMKQLGPVLLMWEGNDHG